jgi:hypothetical protein
LTGAGRDGRRTAVRRLELKQVRVCSRCGRGRAQLESADGDRFEVVLDPPRARELSAGQGGVRSLATFLLEQIAERRIVPEEVIFEQGPAGLRALLSVTRDGETDVVSCTAQEGVELAVRGSLAMYASDDVLSPESTAPRNTLH